MIFYWIATPILLGLALVSFANLYDTLQSYKLAAQLHQEARLLLQRANRRTEENIVMSTRHLEYLTSEFDRLEGLRQETLRLIDTAIGRIDA